MRVRSASWSALAFKRERGLAFIAAACIMCTTQPRPEDRELYLMVLSSLRTELRVDSTVLVHPLLVLLEPSTEDGELRMTDFNAFDKTSVQQIVTAAPTAYRLCTPNAVGHCAVAQNEVAVVLSETLEMGRNGVGVLAFVTDGRSNEDYYRRYLIRMKSAGKDWEVVELRRQGAPRHTPGP